MKKIKIGKKLLAIQFKDVHCVTMWPCRYTKHQEFIFWWRVYFGVSVCPPHPDCQNNKASKKPEVSECDLKFRSCDPRSEVHHLGAALDLCGRSVRSLSPRGPRAPRLAQASASVTLDGPHTKVMMATSIKKPFNSDFLYLAYPSSEKACHSNELASQKWIGAGRREGRSRGTGRGAFQKLSLWEEVPGAGRRGAPGWLLLDWDAEPLVPSPLPLRPSGLAKGADGPGSSFCQLCSPTSQRGRAMWAETQTQNLPTPLTTLASGVKTSPPKCSGREMQEGEGGNSQRFGVDVDSWHTGVDPVPVPAAGAARVWRGKLLGPCWRFHAEVASWLKMQVAF